MVSPILLGKVKIKQLGMEILINPILLEKARTKLWGMYIILQHMDITNMLQLEIAKIM